MSLPIVAYDHQIFSMQSRGGISRYFCELASRVHRASKLQARILGGVHFNLHLAETSAPRSAVYVPPSMLRSERYYAAINRWLWPYLFRRTSPSILHLTYFPAIEPTRRVPTVVTVYDMIHELFPQFFHPADATSANKRRAVAQADHVICISKSTALDLMRLFGTPAEKVSVVHLGYPKIFDVATQPIEPEPLAKPFVLYVGHRTRYKNFRAAVRAYARSPLLRDAVDLVAYGGPPFDAEEVALFADLDLRAGCVVHRDGSDECLARLYRQATALIYPSEYEGFGLPPLEAMASGCPVVCSNTSSLPEVVGSAGLLFDPADVESMTAAMETMVTDKPTRIRLSAAGRAQASTFSWERCAAETVAVYEAVLSRRRQ
jgi:glycosyltransferase involved in cell wall biosynthesis